MTPESRKNKRLIGIFLLACVLLNYPLLSLFDMNVLLFSIPLLYVYIFATWVLLIVILAVVTRAPAETENKRFPPSESA